MSIVEYNSVIDSFGNGDVSHGLSGRARPNFQLNDGEMSKSLLRRRGIVSAIASPLRELISAKLRAGIIAAKRI